MDTKRVFNKWQTLVKQTVDAWIDDDAPSMGAALSYYTVFSLAPMLLIVISVAGMVFGEEAARGEIFGQLRGLMGAAAAKNHRGSANERQRTERGRRRNHHRHRPSSYRRDQCFRRTAGRS